MSSGTTIFIGGGMRTGTTLLQRILCSTPGTNPLIAECQYLTAVMDQYAGMNAGFDVFLADYFESPQAFAVHVRARVEEVLRITAERYRPARVLVLKSPELTRHFAKLAAWFPPARFIVMLRDPRDAIASMLDVAERHRESGQPSALAGYGRDMAKFVALFRSYYKPLARDWDRLRERMLLVRYEDLVQDPDAALRLLAGFTGIELGSRHLAPNQGRVSKQFAKSGQRNVFVRGFVTPLYSETLQASRVGRHRERLSADEIRYIERHCADLAGSLSSSRYW